MFFRQLFEQSSSTYSYLLADENTRDAVLIDSAFEQHPRDAALIRELGLRLVGVLDTHCHAEHDGAANPQPQSQKLTWRYQVTLGDSRFRGETELREGRIFEFLDLRSFTKTGPSPCVAVRFEQ